jgi:hypothetical protein
MTPDSLDVKAGRFVRAIQGHKKIFKEAEMATAGVKSLLSVNITSC